MAHWFELFPDGYFCVRFALQLDSQVISTGTASSIPLVLSLNSYSSMEHTVTI